MGHFEILFCVKFAPFNLLNTILDDLGETGP